MQNSDIRNRKILISVGLPGCWLAGGVLLVNLVIRLAGLHAQGLNIQAVLLSVAVLLLLSWKKSALVRYFCFVLGVTLPLYCYQAYTVNNQIFEFLIVLLGILAWLHLPRDVAAIRVSLGIVGFLCCYILLALFSLVLFPISSFVRLFSLWGLFDFSSAVLSATPENPLYSVAAVNRLVLFFVVLSLLSCQHDAKILYRKLFQGAVLGGLVATVAGVLNQVGMIDLSWFRPQFLDPSGIPRLHSVTGNPGWFTQYLLGCLPFIYLLLPRHGRFVFRLFSVTVIFVFCGVAFLLTASRTSWLLFPLVVFGGYLYIFLFSSSSVFPSWKMVIRKSLKVATILGFVCLLIAGGLLTAVRSDLAENLSGNISRAQYIVQRLRNIVTPGERRKVWRESLVLGNEGPIFGIGYEGYKWHQQIMASIPESRFALSRQTKNNWDTPHSFFIQLFISNGIAGVVIWCLLISYVALLIAWDLFRNKRSFSMMCLVSLFTFLLYGLTQSLQYIPLIWFLLFLLIGYAMILDDRLLPHVILRLRAYAIVLSMLLIVVGAGVYVNNAQSRNLADKYNVARYSIDRGGEVYNGFYPQENWGKGKVFRWSGRRAEIRLNRQGLVGFTFVCNTPGLVMKPLVLNVLLDGRPIDRHTFWTQGKIVRYYWLSNGEKAFSGILEFHVSRTWNPKLAGIANDTRNLGVAVSRPLYQNRVLDRDIGVTAWQASRVQKSDLIRYRWTNRTAVLNLKKYHSGPLTLMLKSEQPNIEKNPVAIQLLQGNKVIGGTRLSNHRWSRLALSPQLDYGAPLTIKVSRTWNPKLEGYGNDSRDLGVAVGPLILETP